MKRMMRWEKKKELNEQHLKWKTFGGGTNPIRMQEEEEAKEKKLFK